jgi:hypothetical protein
VNPTDARRADRNADRTRDIHGAACRVCLAEEIGGQIACMTHKEYQCANYQF